MKHDLGKWALTWGYRVFTQFQGVHAHLGSSFRIVCMLIFLERRFLAIFKSHLAIFKSHH